MSRLPAFLRALADALDLHSDEYDERSFLEALRDRIKHFSFSGPMGPPGPPGPMGIAGCDDWQKVGDDAFARPFGTVRQCIDCGALVAGGPTRCGICAKLSDLGHAWVYELRRLIEQKRGGQ